MTTTDVDTDVDDPPELLCTCCGETEDNCYCSTCSRCGERVETACDNCERCDPCCRCDRCRYCDRMVDSCCGSCQGCERCCECCCCYSCDSLVYPDDFCGECDRCTECCHCDDGSDIIHDYGYRPSPIAFHDVSDGRVRVRQDRREAPDNGIYLGLEIEVEAVHGEAEDIAQVWVDAPFGYPKSDGSLSDGVECVTHPYTYEALRVANLPQTLTRLSEAGARAWGPGTCGLHIHISRKAFAQKSHLWRFANALTRLQNELTTLAGRSGGQWASWATDEYHPSPTKIIAGKKYSQTRYVALNLENTYTVECRFWRGSLNRDHVMGAAAITDALVRWTAVMPYRQVRDGLTWDDFMTWAYFNLSNLQYDDIVALCRRRHLSYPIYPTQGETACAS